MRIGIGYDIHKLVEGRPLMLGGIKIPSPAGLLGYSDADVMLHAVSDAMLGAANLGDIGVHFPDTDPQYKDASSAELLKKVNLMVKEKGYTVNNVDIVVIAESPRINPFVDSMKEKISGVLDLDKSRISIKAKTNDGMGSVGRGEAIASYAVVMLEEE